MKRLLPIIFAIILLPSCASTYFYSTVSTTDQNMIKLHNGDFLVDNDTVSITYSFNGYDVPIWMSIHNKMDKPLLVDWKKSFLIVEDIATSYSKSGGTYEGVSRSYGSAYQTPTGWTFSESSAITRGNIDMPENVTFIPPRTKTEYEGLRVEDINYKEVLVPADYTTMTINGKGDRPKEVQGVDFDPKNSPLRFRSYLTFYAEDIPEKTFVYDQSFFISRVVKTTSSPSGLSPRMSGRGDITFKVEPFQMKTWHYIVATVGTIGGAALIWSLIEPAMDTSIDHSW